MPVSPLPRNRIATTALFALTGLVFATWAARIPAVQERLHLTSASLALVLLAIEGGAVLGLPAGAVLVTRWGSVACLRVGFVVYPAALVGVALAPGLGWLAAVAGVWAAANSVVDVALNAEGVELERRYQRPVLAGLHAGHSLGLLAGALAAVAAAAAGVSLIRHVVLVAAVSVAAAVVACRGLPTQPRRPAGRVLVRPDRRLLLLGAVAFCAFVLDGAANSWSALQLRSDHEASPALAATAYLGFVAALAAGRLASDRLLARHDRVRVVRVAGAVAAAGAGLVVVAPTAGLALTGWVVLGVAVAPLAPAVLGAAHVLTGRSVPVALAAITSLGYLGSFTGPPLVGLLAGPLTVSGALGLLVAAALAVALLARPALRPHSSSRPGRKLGDVGARVWRR